MNLEQILKQKNIDLKNDQGQIRCFIDIFIDMYIKLNLKEVQEIMTKIMIEENKGNKVLINE